MQGRGQRRTLGVGRAGQPRRGAAFPAWAAARPFRSPRPLRSGRGSQLSPRLSPWRGAEWKPRGEHARNRNPLGSACPPRAGKAEAVSEPCSRPAASQPRELPRRGAAPRAGKAAVTGAGDDGRGLPPGLGNRLTAEPMPVPVSVPMPMLMPKLVPKPSRPPLGQAAAPAQWHTQAHPDAGRRKAPVGDPPAVNPSRPTQPCSPQPPLCHSPDPQTCRCWQPPDGVPSTRLGLHHGIPPSHLGVCEHGSRRASSSGTGRDGSSSPGSDAGERSPARAWDGAASAAAEESWRRCLGLPRSSAAAGIPLRPPDELQSAQDGSCRAETLPRLRQAGGWRPW